MPGLRPLGFDKTSVEARLDAGKDEGKLGATLSRSVPINEDLSVTLQNSYSVRQSLASGAPARTPLGDAAHDQRCKPRPFRRRPELGHGPNGSPEPRSFRHDVLGRRRIIDRGHASGTTS